MADSGAMERVMRYTGTKFSQSEAEAIMSSARASVAGARADMQRWRAERQQRARADRFVTKTVDHARVPAPEPAPAQTMDAQTATWVDWVDRRIEEKFDIAIEAAGEALGHERGVFQQALDRRDEKIRNLRRELATLRTELGVKLKLAAELAAARSEIEELRQRAPSFRSELASLQEKVEKVSKQTLRVRTEQSILQYQQKKLDTELSQMKRNAASGAVVEFETSSSRITVGNLHPDAANALREFASQVVDAWDGDAILFSGPAGTA
jgi:hypothetical protein